VVRDPVQEAKEQIRLVRILIYTLLGALSYLLCIHFIGVESMRYSDEVTHARVIQEGIDSGAWFRLTLDGEPYYRKPPFKMWLTRFIITLFGEGNFQYRILDGLATLGTVVATMFLAFRLFGSHLTAVLCGLLLLGSSDFLVESRNNQGTQDAMLLFLITASMCVGLRLVRQARIDNGGSIRGLVIVLSVLLGMAISTKSLAGGIPALLLFSALVFTLRTGFTTFLLRHRKILILAPFLVLAIPGLYYGPLFLREPGAWEQVFQVEIFDRLLGEGYHNQQHWDFYLSGVFVRRPTFPVPIMLLGAVVAIGHLIYNRDRAAWGFLLVWIALPLVLYSSFSSRVFHYIAPIFPALAILSSQGLAWATTAALRWVRACSLATSLAKAACCSLALVPCYSLIGSQLRDSIRSVSTSGKKIDIEKIVTEIRASRERAPTRTILFNMEKFLAGTGNQAWRFKFYLHFIQDESRSESQIEGVLQATALPGPLWVLAPIEYRDELTRLSSPCEVRPFVHPEGKRSHYRSNELHKGLGKPQLVLIRYQC
jgi:4-amino-4-deoxy-L-arabinose transferase-like glycosyltransferase